MTHASFLIRPIALACLAFGALHAEASTLAFSGYAHGAVATHFEVLAPNLPTHGDTGAGGFAVTLDGGPSFTAYCVDLYQYIAWTANDYTQVAGAAHGFSTPNAYQDIGRLYSAHHSVNDATSEAAFQIAVWEIAYETSGSYDAGDGTARFTSAAAGLANSWLAALPAINTFDVHVVESPRQQDLVFATPAVPEPSTYALLAAGLLAIGVATRRRTNAQR